MPFGPIGAQSAMMWAASMNPVSWWSGWANAIAPKVGPIYPRQEIDTSKPPAVESHCSDPGLHVSKAAGRVTVRGVAMGPRLARDPMGIPLGLYARSIGLGLDLRTAPTEDIFGKTNYTEKNSRSFQVCTERGWSAEKVARMLAAKINGHPSFSARVSVAPDGVATILLARG